MNIIILSSSKQQQGGVERFSFYVQRCLEKYGHQVTILGKEDLNACETMILKLKKIFGMEQPALGYFLGRKAMNRGCDVCVTNGMLGWNITNKKVINVQHGTFARAADRIDRHRNVFKYFVKKYIWGFFEGLAVRRATVCVAVGEETKESVINYYYREDVVVIHNATDTDLFKPLDKIMCRSKMKIPIDKHTVLFVGRFEYAKGKNILEGVQKYLKEHSGELIVAENYSQEELALLYNAADAFILPSLHEGCSYALLDAVSSGLPFLASPVGLVSELKHTGLFNECIVDEQTIEAYSSRFKLLFNKTGGEKAQLSQALRNYILEKHTLDVFGTAYHQLVQKIIKL